MAEETDSIFDLSPDQVAAYLRTHPDFFTQHPSLLTELNFTHTTNASVSLVERQVALLRERNTIMRSRMNELLENAKTNDELFAKTRSLTLALLNAHTWPKLNEVFATYVLTEFRADFVACHVLEQGMKMDHIVSHEQALPSDGFITNQLACCTVLREDEMAALFPAIEHTGPGSVVLLPLKINPSGCLAIGSRDPNRFTPDMDTLFVDYIADITSHIIKDLLR